jgi:uncharacterized membrane protein
MKTSRNLRRVGVALAISTAAIGFFYVSAMYSLRHAGKYAITAEFGSKHTGNAEYSELLARALEINEARYDTEFILTIIIISILLAWSATIYALGAKKKEYETEPD